MLEHPDTSKSRELLQAPMLEVVISEPRQSWSHGMWEPDRSCGDMATATATAMQKHGT